MGGWSLQANMYCLNSWAAGVSSLNTLPKSSSNHPTKTHKKQQTRDEVGIMIINQKKET